MEGTAMLSTRSRPWIPRAVLVLLAAAALLPIAGCRDVSSDAGSRVDLTPFKAMARAADCVDKRNRLFLIDDRSVFWDRESSACADALYSVTLFGSTVETVLCERHDAIGGGNVTNCPYDAYRDMFETIVTNLDDPSLGLGPGHTVQVVPF
jgi:hypothetical protein